MDTQETIQKLRNLQDSMSIEISAHDAASADLRDKVAGIDMAVSTLEGTLNTQVTSLKATYDKRIEILETALTKAGVEIPQ